MGGMLSGNSFLIKQFMIREDKGGRWPLPDLLGVCTQQDKKEQREGSTTTADREQSTTFGTSQRAVLKHRG